MKETQCRYRLAERIYGAYNKIFERYEKANTKEEYRRVYNNTLLFKKVLCRLRAYRLKDLNTISITFDEVEKLRFRSLRAALGYKDAKVAKYKFYDIQKRLGE